ncbi:hypothetical protein [Pengzhenrongella phosphoraccumulans]|uniref:hypothetical protein n=1 Tax=Pengzhenrongella phosphoraccumulans TaxID=3114394 RepID=UPI00388EE1A1
MTFPIGAKSSTQASTLNTPPCGPYQVDLYGGVALESIDKNGTPDFRAGGLVDRPNCPTPVVPVAPTWTPGTCLAEGTVTLEQNPSYIWSFVETENGRDYTATATPGHAITTQGPWPVKIAQLSPDSPECLPAVLPVSVITQAQVTPIPPTCDADGSLTLTNGESYTWSDTRPLAVGRHEVIATAAAGYVFSDLETTATFTVEVLAATGDQSTDATAGCYIAAVPPVVDPPVVDPPVVVPVVPVVTPVAVVASKTVASKTVASETPAVNNRVLAYTGIDGLPWLLLGAAGLIGFGGLTVSRASRERRVSA